MNGQTIGKKLLQIKVINIDGFKPSITDYIIRWFLRIVDFNLASLIFIYIVSLGFSDLFVLLWVVFIFGKLIGFFLILFTCCTFKSKNNGMDYLPDQTPNGIPLEFKPELTRDDKLIHKGIFSPDLSAYYFTMSDHDFEHFNVHVIHKENGKWYLSINSNESKLLEIKF